MFQLQNTISQLSRASASLLAPVVVLGEVKWRIVILTAASFAAMC